MADEFHRPEEFPKASEFPVVKEVFISAPEFPGERLKDVPAGSGSSAAKPGSRTKEIRKMMMYLATLVTTMGSVFMFSTEAQEKPFDKREYLKTHHDWYNAQDDEYIYMGDNGWAWIALRSEDGRTYDDFYHYKRWRFLEEDIDEYTMHGYGYNINWSLPEIDSEREDTGCRFVKTDDGYVVDAYDPAHPEQTKRIVPLDPDKADYPGKQYMMKYLEASTQDLLNEFNTYVLENGAPVYTDIEKIVFNPDGTGTFRIKGKQSQFTYKTDDDKASNFFTVYYRGRSARACLYFYGEKPTMMFFGGLEDEPNSFAAFIATGHYPLQS